MSLRRLSDLVKTNPWASQSYESVPYILAGPKHRCTCFLGIPTQVRSLLQPPPQRARTGRLDDASEGPLVAGGVSRSRLDGDMPISLTPRHTDAAEG